MPLNENYNVRERYNEAMGGGMKRAVSDIKRIGVHWTVSAITATTAAFENHWRSLGWGTGGYHEVVLRDGTIEKNYRPDTITNGVGDHNSDTYHISYVANPNEPITDKQLRVLLTRLYELTQELNVNVNNVLGHNEFPNTNRFNHRSNQCPNLNMNEVRNAIRNGDVNEVKEKEKAAPEQPSRPNSSRPINTAKELHLPASADTWRIYRPEGPYTTAHAIHQLTPAAFGGITYEIKGNPAQDVYLIDVSEDLGRRLGTRRVAIYAGPNTSATVSGSTTASGSTSANSGRRQLHLPVSAETWRIYRENGPYTAGNEVHKLTPARFGGLTYDILGEKGNHVYVINTGVRGRVAIYAGPNTSARITG